MIGVCCNSVGRNLNLKNISNASQCVSVSRRATRKYSSHLFQAHASKDLDLARLNQSYSESDRLSSEPIQLLDSALEDYLPVKDELLSQPKWMQIGYQHAYFRPRLRRRDLCDDGTDVKFLPGPADIWKYRLWAGGSVITNRMADSIAMPPNGALLTERASSLRVVEADGRPTKVFVTIERRVVKGDKSQDTTSVSVVDRLDEDHVFTSDSHYLTETENICFLRDPPSSLQDQRRIKPPSDPVFTHTMIPTRGLLFQFSALTYNAHSIHIDSEFARNVYGAKDLVVHGPLTQVLMIQFLSRYLASLSSCSPFIPIPWYIRYTNLQPLYVDRPLTLCCKPTATPPNVGNVNSDSWQVWIQTGEGKEASCAVKASVNVKPRNA